MNRHLASSASIQPADVERFRLFIGQRLGLQYDDGKLDFLGDVLRRRMQASHAQHYDAYEALVAGAELRALVDLLTVNETFFFRNADNFRALVERVLPERIAARRNERRLRIVSAGCASGDEPYSLAIALYETLPELPSWDVQIVAVDLNQTVLAKAAAARYSQWSLRATREDTRARYFRSDGKDFVLDPIIQRMVRFEQRNLVEDDPAFWREGSCDLVFCRNVIMYFTPSVMQAVVRRIHQALVPGGFLFLGHAETLRGLSSQFHLCHTHDTFYYQRRGAAGVTACRSEPVPPRHAVLGGSLPGIVDTTSSWVDVIQQASEKIAALASERTGAGADAARAADAPAARSWDLGPILEAMRHERFADALELLSALPPNADNDPDVLLVGAVLLTNAGRLADAEATCTRLLLRDELSAGAHYAMALCREHAGDAAAAIEHDQTAIYLDASFAMPHLHLGIMARRTGDPATAARELAQAEVLLAREDAARLLLFGGGFARETLVELCRRELATATRGGSTR